MRNTTHAEARFSTRRGLLGVAVVAGLDGAHAMPALLAMPLPTPRAGGRRAGPAG